MSIGRSFGSYRGKLNALFVMRNHVPHECLIHNRIAAQPW
jgi:hypothetical protein